MSHRNIRIAGRLHSSDEQFSPISNGMAHGRREMEVDRRVEGAEPRLGCVAIAWTPLQQVVLIAILRQEHWKIDVLFVREGMHVFDSIRQISAKIVTLPEVSYSARAIGLYRRAGRDLIHPALAGIGAYRCLTWTRENPLARFIFARSACKSIVLFEDGTGTYVDYGRFCWRLGPKYMATKLLINLGLWRIHNLRMSVAEAEAEICVLFPAALPGGTAFPKLVSHDCFRQVLQDVNASDQEICDLPDGAILYLPSPFEDFHLLTEEEEIEVNVEALRRFLDSESRPGRPVLWKSHPHAMQDMERGRMEKVSNRLGIRIRSLPAVVISEQIALANQNLTMSIVSPSSSSIYTLKALGNPRHRLVCVDSPLLRSRVPMISDLYAFYRKIGIEVIS